MVDPDVGGGVGWVGLPLPNLLQAARSVRPPAATPIRRIGEWRARQKKVFMDSRIYSIPFTRMAYPVKDGALSPLQRLRGLAATAAAVAMGAIGTVSHRSESLPELKPGDHAPDFALTGSDGRTYRLKDLAGRPVALAWFPKAFTGG